MTRWHFRLIDNGPSVTRRTTRATLAITDKSTPCCNRPSTTHYHLHSETMPAAPTPKYQEYVPAAPLPQKYRSPSPQPQQHVAVAPPPQYHSQPQQFPQYPPSQQYATFAPPPHQYASQCPPQNAPLQYLSPMVQCPSCASCFTPFSIRCDTSITVYNNGPPFQ